MRTLKRSLWMASCALACVLTTGCGDDGGDPINTDGALTLDSCTTNIADDVPDFYKTYFRCVDISMNGGNVVISTDGLPPHLSAYYPEGDANHTAFDTSGGNMQIPAEIGAQNISVTIPTSPTAKGITIDNSLIDGTLNTSNEEYSGGPGGVALNGVAYFSGAAAMGMNISEEAMTFDAYQGHPAMTTYHYHGQSAGPLEVLQANGIATSTTPGSANVEVYAMMCDGTLVLGCTELDGSAPDTSDADAQGGHVHDISDGTTTHFTARYHTHVCPGTAADFSPEAQYYNACP